MDEKQFERCKSSLNQLEYDCNFILAHLPMLHSQLEQVFNEQNEQRQFILAKAFDHQVDTMTDQLQIIHL